jgi:hypothetical protein
MTGAADRKVLIDADTLYRPINGAKCRRRRRQLCLLELWRSRNLYGVPLVDDRYGMEWSNCSD